MKQNSIARLRPIPIRRSLLAIFVVLAIATAFAAFGVPVNTSWTYQGQLQRSGAAYTGTCNFQFSLWDALSAGTQQGTTLPINSVNVVNGLFTVVLDFGDLFDGDARWLGTSVQCSGDGGFTPLDPRQALTAAPYALSLRPGATIGGSNSGGALNLTNALGVGVSGTGAAGVLGKTNKSGGVGVSGQAQGGPNSAGVLGTNTDAAGVWGLSLGTGPGILGGSAGGGLAAEFVGNVTISGTLTKGMGSFKIDHPLDPANKFLSHSFVESPDMMNIYNGNVTTDATGNAIVPLPAYFETLNRDFRYQLTVLGQFAQAIVSRKIAGNSFEIRTDKPGIEVSWQVTGIRQDAYARAHPIVVEEFKPAEQQGMYLFPAGFDAGEEKRLGSPSRLAPTQDAQGPTTASQSAQAPGK